MKVRVSVSRRGGFQTRPYDHLPVQRSVGYMNSTTTFPNTGETK
jgi:hypothetical protein